MRAANATVQRTLGSCLCGLILLGLIGAPSSLVAQTPASEHESHHPAPSPVAPAVPSSPPSAAGPSGMDSMMERMGVPPPLQIFPEMMRLESPSPEDRRALIARAQERRAEGARRLAAGIEQIDHALRASDSVALSAALAEARAGLDELESGLATTKALERGDAPPAIALWWFKDELTLAGAENEPGSWALGRGALHAGVMALLTIFSLTMIAMYFHKMRRASSLLAELARNANPPPTSSLSPPHAREVPATAPRSESAAPVSPGRAVPQPAVTTSSPAPPARAPAMASRFETLRKTGGCGECKSPCSVRVRVARTFDETPNVKTFRLTALDGGPLPFEYLPGQFLNVIAPSAAAEGSTTKRSYTIASSPTQSAYCEITVKREAEGVVSRYLHDTVRAGGEIRVSAPYGRFCFTGEEAPGIILIGGGVGITPLMSVVRYLTDLGWPGEIVLIFGFRDAQDFIFRAELERLARQHPNLRVVPVASGAVDAAWTGRRGRIDAALVREVVPDIASRLVHLCGPKPMMDAARAFLRELGVPRERVRFESFGPGAAQPRAVAAVVAAAAVTLPTVTFARSSKAAPLPANGTVLEVAESLGVEIEWSCRSGTCGSCKVKLLSGKVSMEVEDGLDDEDRAAGLILACQARATGDIAVEA